MWDERERVLLSLASPKRLVQFVKLVAVFFRSIREIRDLFFFQYLTHST